MAVNEELVEKLLNEDDAFRKAFNTHREFQKRVAEIEMWLYLMEMLAKSN